MKRYRLIIACLIVLLSGCFEPERDAEVEAKVSSLLEGEFVYAPSTFGHIVVYTSSPIAFEMAPKTREELAAKIANIVLEIRAESKSITIAFARPGQGDEEKEEIVYSWKNENGTLKPISI